jgi:bifunctional oligoribonuclease and PAP phosphatase NrnA
MNNPDLGQARRLIAEAERVLAVTHISPDGDAIGSLLGFGLSLRELGKQVLMVCADGVPDIFEFLPASGDVVVEPTGQFDLVVALDVSDPARMGAIGQALPRPVDIQFDHHITNPQFASVNFVNAGAASTAEQLAELMPELGLPVTAEVAECLLTGLVTDTLGFRTSNTTAKTLAIAQHLMQAGAALHAVYDRALNKRSYSAVRLWGEGLARMKYHKRVVWARLPLDARREAGYHGNGDADLINVLTTVREADVALIFVERPDGLIKISWRSVPGINVANVAAQFGGGGHAQAAGAEMAGSMDEVEARVLAATRAAMAASRLEAAPAPASNRA